MAINEYDIGDVVRLQGVFTSTNSTALTPSSVTVWVQAPSSTVLVVNTGSLINPTSGTYFTDIVVATTGVWKYRIFSTGTGQTAEDDLFRVATPLVASTGT